jgi:pilus assembly protein CpaB
MQFRNRSMPSESLQRVVSTRSGMAATAVFVAVLAGVVLLLFMSRYRETVKDSAAPGTVLVAKDLIEKGSSGDVIAGKGLFEATSMDNVEHGALTDPSSLRGKQASSDIYPGEQLVASDFTDAGDSVGSRITDRERAISIPLDSAHGMIGDVIDGDRVDVLAGFNVQPDGAARPKPVLKAVMQNALVLRAPGKPKQGGLNGPTSTQNIVLRAPDQDAWDFAFSSEFGKVWIVLRPKVGAKQTRPSLVTLERLLFGLKPITVEKALRSRG